jgi:hypothetical protein
MEIHITLATIVEGTPSKEKDKKRRFKRTAEKKKQLPPHHRPVARPFISSLNIIKLPFRQVLKSMGGFFL